MGETTKLSQARARKSFFFIVQASPDSIAVPFPAWQTRVVLCTRFEREAMLARPDLDERGKGSDGLTAFHHRDYREGLSSEICQMKQMKNVSTESLAKRAGLRNLV